MWNLQCPECRQDITQGQSCIMEPYLGNPRFWHPECWEMYCNRMADLDEDIEGAGV